ncbi:MAG: hypothetical protein KDK99_06030, partial [Verrucomicrobiales bacterium]|nr:hypothetical protein [Verrucomicrobiales bacterium]
AQWAEGSRVVETPYLEGSLTLLDNETGGVLAVVGGRDYLQSRFNRAVNGSRQIGSTVKPFVYAAGLEAGLLPGTMVSDAPLQAGEIDEAASDWNPSNSDGKFLGPLPMAEGLVQSRNTMTIRVGNYAGLKRVMELLQDAGLGGGMERTPQVFIGNVAANSYGLATAFSVFPNEGARKRPYVIQRIVDGTGRVLYQTPVLEVEVLRPAVALLTRQLLERVMNEGTAASLRRELGFKAWGGGKTGTTNDYRDAWFAGYTARLTAAVWVGFDQSRPIVDEGYGSRLALPVWADVMQSAINLGYTGKPPADRVPMTQVRLCRQSGLLGEPGCEAAGAEYEAEMPYELVPQGFCTLHGEGQQRSSGGLLQRLKGWLR